MSDVPLRLLRRSHSLYNKKLVLTAAQKRKRAARQKAADAAALGKSSS